MPTVAAFHLLRVFAGVDGHGGNPLAVFLEGGQVAPAARQRTATEVGLSETVFVDDARRGEIAIYTPAVELDFAGHPSVGTAWLLAREHGSAPVLRPPAGEVPARADAEGAFVAARPEWGPPFEWEQLEAAADVDALDGPPHGHDLIGAWAWLDEAAGSVRARVFTARLGMDEDEATGAAATKLCARLRRPIDIRQGVASQILARPRDDGRVEVGGRVELDEVRAYSPSSDTKRSS